MTREEAILILGNDKDDLIDNYEVLLFDFKQYFLTKPIVSKLYYSQFKKMLRLSEAAARLDLTFQNYSIEEPEFSFVNSIIDDFQLFEQLRAEIKMRILNSTSVEELIQSAELLLKVQSEYINLWPDIHGIEEKDVVIGKEPDPMDLLKDLKILTGRGIVRFEQLTISQCETLVTLFNEWKRLSLLCKKELEWKKISSAN